MVQYFQVTTLELPQCSIVLPWETNKGFHRFDSASTVIGLHLSMKQAVILSPNERFNSRERCPFDESSEAQRSLVESALFRVSFDKIIPLTAGDDFPKLTSDARIIIPCFAQGPCILQEVRLWFSPFVLFQRELELDASLFPRNKSYKA